MKKIQTIYKLTETVQLIVNEDYPDSLCLTQNGEVCEGILRHYGSKAELLRELNEIIAKLEIYGN